MIKSIIILTIIVFFPLDLRPQDIRAMQESFLEAEYFLINEDYEDALQEYLQIFEMMPGNANLAYRIGVCYLNISGTKNLATGYLETASKKMSSRHKEGKLVQETAPYDALYQLGISYRINHQFDKAKDAFEKYRKTLLKEDKENLSFIDHEIKVCENAEKLIEKPIVLTLENMGNQFNDAFDDFNPVISADGRTFIFMKALPFYDAVMFSRFIDGRWTPPVNIVPELKIDGGHSVSSLSSDGKTLFISMDDNYNSDILSSSFDGTKWSKAVKLNNNINTKYWESHGFISEDGNYLVFASDRPGSLGGLDLYISKKENGDWGPAVNLGPDVNSRFNEDRPSLVNNGKTLFFASQDHDNIGGYDILRTEMQENGEWKKPQNPGYPFNTTDDDVFFMPVDNARAGFVSIFRQNEGEGKKDIYRITFK
jgi:tetratricopeptide (TPR) repeat protein